MTPFNGGEATTVHTPDPVKTVYSNPRLAPLLRGEFIRFVNRLAPVHRLSELTSSELILLFIDKYFIMLIVILHNIIYNFVVYSQCFCPLIPAYAGYNT
ncbi:hypothetical protein D3C81_1829020 [compost metagenome]